MVNDDKYRIGEEDVELLGKLDNIFIKESELLFYKEIAKKQISTSVLKSAKIKSRIKIGTTSILAITILSYFGFLLSREDNKIDNTTTLENILFTEAKTDKIQIDSTIVLDSNLSETDKSSDRLIKPDPRAKILRIEKKNGPIEDELIANREIKDEAEKLPNSKIVDGYQLSKRESVISTSVVLKNGISVPTLQSKLIQIMNKLNLDYINQTSENDVINISSKKYPGILKTSEKALFSFHFKVSKENSTKLQLMLRYNKIEALIDDNDKNFKNIDNLYYHQLKLEVLSMLKDFIN